MCSDAHSITLNVCLLHDTEIYRTLYSKSKMSLNREKLLTNDVDMSTILFVMAKLLLGKVTAYIFLKRCRAIQCLSCYSFRSHVKPWAYLINSFKFRQGKYQSRKPVKKTDYVVDWQNISLKMFVGCLLNIRLKLFLHQLRYTASPIIYIETTWNVLSVFSDNCTQERKVAFWMGHKIYQDFSPGQVTGNVFLAPW